MSELIAVLYIIAFALFIYGLMGLTGPRTAVRGNLVAGVGMAIAIVATLLTPGTSNWLLIALGLVLGTVIGRAVGEAGQDDRDAAVGRSVQRSGRRRGGAGGLGGVPRTATGTRPWPDTSPSLRFSPQSSVRSPSGDP